MILRIANKNSIRLIEKIVLSSSSCINRSIFTCGIRLQQQKAESMNNKSIIESHAGSNDQISTHVTGARRVKQAAKDVSYGAIILGGGALLLGIFYYLFSELFSRETPSGIYDESSDICIKDYHVNYSTRVLS